MFSQNQLLSDVARSVHFHERFQTMHHRLKKERAVKCSKLVWSCGVALVGASILGASCGRANDSSMQTESAGSVASTDLQFMDRGLSAQGRIEETILSSCYLDAPFRPGSVFYSRAQTGQSYTWWTAHYNHGYVERKNVMVTTFDSSGNIQQQVTVTRNTPFSKALTSSITFWSWSQDRQPGLPNEAINHMKQLYDGEVSARMLMQCGN